MKKVFDWFVCQSPNRRCQLQRRQLGFEASFFQLHLASSPVFFLRHLDFWLRTPLHTHRTQPLNPFLPQLVVWGSTVS